MAVWVIRAGRMGENEEFALNEGVYSIGFSQERSVADFSDYESLRDYIHRQSEGLSLQQVASQASQLWHFAHDMRGGEVVVLPRKRRKVIAVGRIVGEYVYCYVERRDESLAPLPHTRKVGWLAKSVPLENFDEGMQKSFKNSQSNVVRVRKTNSEARVEQAIGAYIDD
ncbi:MAG: hypothetical protein OXI16_05385 [Chloroflexota bacterium]|nr:hypothetical protein [Chloroflexota bacterium]